MRTFKVYDGWVFEMKNATPTQGRKANFEFMTKP
jgi:hypothetical protein